MQSTASIDTSESSELQEDILGKPLESPDPREVPALVRRYIRQLINGCDNTDDCKEVLCRTGLRNTSNGKPVRDYTPRSARTIAIAMCAGPRPWSHLCQYTTAETASAVDQSPSDPSSLDQQLSETRAFKILQEPGTLCFQDLELKYHHDQVSRLIETAGKEDLSNEQLMDGLTPSAEWLLAKLPHQRTASYIMVNDLISKGYAYPTKDGSMPADDNFNNWLKILDTLHHKPYLRLLGRIVQVIAVRQASSLALEGIHHARLKPPPSWRDKPFFKQLFLGPPQIYALLVWLKRLAAEHWDGRPEVKVGSICVAAWSMLNGLANVPDEKSMEEMLSFYQMPMIWIRLSAAELVQSYRASIPPGPQSQTYHLLDFRTLFSMKQLTLYFRMLNHLKMRYEEYDGAFSET